MKRYYIKIIWGPHGQNGYPWSKPSNFKNVIGFNKKSYAERFLDSYEFLLYESGKKEKGGVGAKSIYAYGVPKEAQYPSGDKNFPFGVSVFLKKKIDPLNSISLPIIRKIIKRKNIQAHGGLIEVNEWQFNRLHNLIKQSN